MSENQTNKSRRDFLKKTAYTAPTILAFQVKPSMASTGSGLVDRGNDPSESDHGRDGGDHDHHHHHHHAHGGNSSSFFQAFLNWLRSQGLV